MAESFYHVALPETAKSLIQNGKDKCIVSAESSAEAILAAKAYMNLPSDEAWAAATVTALAHVTDLEGWRVNINIADTSGDTVEDVTVTATSGDGFDEIGALLVTALNATDSISGAAYSTPTLTVAAGSGTDNLGDHTVTCTFLPPTTWDDPTIEFSSIFSTITHEGLATADLSVVLLDVVAPTVLYEVN